MSDQKKGYKTVAEIRVDLQRAAKAGVPARVVIDGWRRMSELLKKRGGS